MSGIWRAVGLDLVERPPQRRVLLARTLQLHQHQRQAVDEQHHVRARVSTALHRELVDRQPGRCRSDRPSRSAAPERAGSSRPRRGTRPARPATSSRYARQFSDIDHLRLRPQRRLHHLDPRHPLAGPGSAATMPPAAGREHDLAVVVALRTPAHPARCPGRAPSPSRGRRAGRVRCASRSASVRCRTHAATSADTNPPRQQQWKQLVARPSRVLAIVRDACASRTKATSDSRLTPCKVRTSLTARAGMDSLSTR